MFSRLKNTLYPLPDKIPMNLRIRSIVALTSKDTKPPISEPNVPEKRDRKDEKQEERDKKPVLKTETNTQDSVYKYQWGVKVSDNDSDQQENAKSRNYIATDEWNVDLTKFKALETTASTETSTTDKFVDTSAASAATNFEAGEQISGKVTENRETKNFKFSGELGLNSSHEDDSSLPKDIDQGNEISAWRDVVTRSQMHEQELARRDAMFVELQQDPISSIFIRPEPPTPKLDVQVVRSIEDIAENNKFVAAKKFHTSCKSFASNGSNSTSGDGKACKTVPSEPGRLSNTDCNVKNGNRAFEENRNVPKIEDDLSNVLQDLSQREMEVLLSYSYQDSTDTGNCPKLPTSVTISTFPPGSQNILSKNDQQKNVFYKLDAELDNEASGNVLERTIFKRKDSDEKEDGRDIKDKKSHRDSDYIRVPGDPYPYSKEHYEKWRAPHGKCPIVNDDVPKVKPAETSDSPL